MDAPGGMNPQKADQALRDLFRTNGGLAAPEGMEARVLAQLAVTPQRVPPAEHPLLPWWTWVMGGALAAAIALTHRTWSIHWPATLPAPDLDKVWRSPWLVMGLATCVLLLALNAWLNARVNAARVR